MNSYAQNMEQYARLSLIAANLLQNAKDADARAVEYANEGDTLHVSLALCNSRSYLARAKSAARAAVTCKQRARLGGVANGRV